jgi:hypothetical protein
MTGSPAVALLRNVQVQSSACADEVSFLFSGGTPGWSVGYRSGPVSAGPSGAPVQVPGAARLLVRLEPASGVDAVGPEPRAVYDGPTTLTPEAPSAVTKVVRLGDFEDVSTWAVGLPGVRPFDVAVRGDQLVVHIGAPAPRVTRCTVPGTSATVGYPADWYAELSDRWPFRYFNSSPFVVYPATDAMGWAVTVEPAGAPAPAVVATLTGNGTGVAKHTTHVAGVAATVLDVTSTGAGLYPAGYQSRTYVVATTPTALLIFSSPAPPGAPADHNLAAVERMTRLVEIS